MKRRHRAFRYLLGRLHASREYAATLEADLADAIDALTPSSLTPSLCGCRYCQQGRIEDAVRDMTPLPPMVAVGLGRAMKWGRS